MALTPKDPVFMAVPYLQCSDDVVDGDEFDSIVRTPKDPVSMPTPSLEGSEDVVEEEEEDTEKYWSEEMQEQFENWFREYPFRPKGIDTCCFGEKIVEGMALMEIFDVRVISHAKSRRKLNLNGRITVHGAYGESEIFARTRERPEKLYPQERLTLTGPQIAILGYGLVDIRLNLKDDDHQVCVREETWCSSACGLDFKFNHMRTVKIKGKKGFNFHMKFAVFENANLITVDIELPKVINNGENNLVKIVEAYIETSECRLLKTTLFNSKRDDGQVNSNGGKLPLSKSLLAFPVGGALRLDLFFPDHSNSFGTTKKSVKFVPTRFGREEMVVKSEYGSVVVGFTAYPVDVHPPTLASAKIHYWRLKWPKLWENHW